jgi:outer membrane protein TolC
MTVAIAAVAGCVSDNQKIILQNQLSPLAEMETDACSPQTGPVHETVLPEFSVRPRTSETALPDQWLQLSLDEAIALSLQNSVVLRSLNATVTRSPQSAATPFDAAIQSSDPNFGVQTALSQFDSNLTASLNHFNNDDVFNNSILGGGATEVVQDLTRATFGLNRTTWTGTQLAFDANVTYDNNNNISSTFPSSYNAFWQGQVRQPLLQGRGLAFNRIAGPNARPGFLGTSGFLIGRINTDISVDEFEKGVVAHIDEVVRAYWDLYFAIRNFKSVKSARDSSLKTWNSVKARFDNDLQGGEADLEAEAREQYFQFEERMLAALNGDARTGSNGVYQAEADLRRLIGMPQSDDRLLWPVDEPTPVETAFDWETLSANAIANRVEVRQQARRVRQRELELLASRNFLLPRLDAVATFRNNGFGDDLAFNGSQRFSSALQDLLAFQRNEWEFGVQLDVPVGFRQAQAGVRNSELELMRERALLTETRRQILHELGTSIRQTDQASKSAKLNFNRKQAAEDALKSRTAAYEAGNITVDRLLEAVQRLADATSQFERSQTNYQVSSAAIKRDSGVLLHEFGIMLNSSQTYGGSPIDVSATGAPLVYDAPIETFTSPSNFVTSESFDSESAFTNPPANSIIRNVETFPPSTFPTSDQAFTEEASIYE